MYQLLVIGLATMTWRKADFRLYCAAGLAVSGMFDLLLLGVGQRRDLGLSLDADDALFDDNSPFQTGFIFRNVWFAGICLFLWYTHARARFLLIYVCK